MSSRPVCETTRQGDKMSGICILKVYISIKEV